VERVGVGAGTPPPPPGEIFSDDFDAGLAAWDEVVQ
jgi:hypothetical protein